MSKNPICEMLSIKYPIFQGGMAWIAEANLASAVSNAGGLGIIAGMNLNGEALRAEIKKTKALTDKTFGVNLMLMSPYIEEAVDVVCEEHIKVVTTGAGNPAPYMSKLTAAGVKVIPVVASVALAKMVERIGASAVIAEGCESGGHVGETTTMALVPQVVDNVNIPVIAAGGIGDYRGMAAAYMLGACGVQMGTRFLATKECIVHSNYKEKVIKASDIETVVTGKTLGHPVRALRNKMTREYIKLENSGDKEAIKGLGSGTLRLAAIDGDVVNGTCMCGQIAGLIKCEETCEDVILDIYNNAMKLIGGET